MKIRITIEVPVKDREEWDRIFAGVFRKIVKIIGGKRSGSVFMISSFHKD